MLLEHYKATMILLSLYVKRSFYFHYMLLELIMKVKSSLLSYNEVTMILNFKCKIILPLLLEHIMKVKSSLLEHVMKVKSSLLEHVMKVKSSLLEHIMKVKSSLREHIMKVKSSLLEHMMKLK